MEPNTTFLFCNNQRMIFIKTPFMTGRQHRIETTKRTLYSKQAFEVRTLCVKNSSQCQCLCPLPALLSSFLRWNEGLLPKKWRTPTRKRQNSKNSSIRIRNNNRQHDQCGDAPVGFLRRQQRPFQIRLVRGAENRKSSQQLGRKRQERMGKKSYLEEASSFYNK